ncbi:molybdopterin molybdotransferase [Gammaproteobacteria bacterium]
MTTNTSHSCSEFDPTMLSVSDASAHIMDTIRPVECVEQIALHDALDRILAEDLASPRAVPGYDNSAMDGYALRSADLPTTSDSKPLHLIGTALAGKPYGGAVGSGECVRIMTGAVIPNGSDTVVMQEHARVEAGMVFVGDRHRRGDHVRRRGDDLTLGQTVLSAGRRLTPADLGLIASLGVTEVKVRRCLRVAFFSTGDELCPLGDPLAVGQIYDSNRYTLFGLLNRLGVEILDLGIIRDRREDLRTAFTTAASAADVVITSGGVSVGEADLVMETLKSVGQVAFWKIAMKPGKPFAFGQIGSALFFGLPGNPVSVMATFQIFVQPALRRLAGEQPKPSFRLHARCLEALKKHPGRIDFQRGVMETGPGGELTVRSTGEQGSHILSSMSHANCFIVLPLESGNVAPDTWVEVEPFVTLL